jgi:hypothetical protein
MGGARVAFEDLPHLRETKPLDDFYKMAGMRDGHRSECKQCNLADKRRRYADDPAKDIAMASPARRAIKRW